MGKLLAVVSRTTALALTIGTSAIVTNCGQEMPRKTGMTSPDGTPPAGGTGGAGAVAGMGMTGEGTGGGGASQPPSECAQVIITPRATIFWGIWISPTGEILVAGEDGFIGHGTGSRSGGGAWSFCQRTPGVTLRAIWGATDTDVWAVGDGGAIVHWDGVHWTALADVGAPAPGNLYDVWGNADAHTVWIVGDGGVVRRFDGSSWQVDDTDARYQLRSVWGTDTGPVRVVGAASLPPVEGINGEEAVVLRRNGDTWAREAAFETDRGAALGFCEISGASDSDIWAVGVKYSSGAAESFAFAAHFDGGASLTARAGLGVAGGPTERDQLGGTFYADVVAAPPQAPSGALIASPPAGTLFDGATWTTSPPSLTALDRRGSALWATGAAGEVLRWTGSAWQLDIGP